MKFSLCLLAIAALLPLGASAETTLGTVIDSVPYTITKSGVYHFTKDLSFTRSSDRAIYIEATDVVIDLNAHELVATYGPGNSAIGIESSGYARVTIEDGTIRGFQNGLVLTNDSALVQRLLVTNNLASGITVVGNNAQISGNRVCNTGGSTVNTTVYAIGISLTGTYGNVCNNDVQNTYQSDNTGHYANGIRLKDCLNVVINNNRVLDVEPSTPTKAMSYGIETITSNNLVMLANTVLMTWTGFDLSGGAGGDYGDNISNNAVAPYNTTGSGMTDIGGNN